MKRAPSSLNPWVWPVNIERYDRTPELKRQEVEALERNLPRLEQGVLPFNVMREANVHRLLDPLEDVFDHVGFRRIRRPGLKILLLKEMLRRGRSQWGWTEDEWLETIEKSGRERHSVSAAAYLLCQFDGLHRLGRRNFVFCCLSHRIFGRERLHALFSEVREMLLSWGYRERLAGV
jgi:hypothetical protein